jgi:predicted nucleotidyltransferase component of viral defense system
MKQYPSYLHDFKEHILKEYLQYHILEWIFNGPFASKLCFIGGTALRLCYGHERFSEDLDFDNNGLSFEDFELMIAYANKNLLIKGFETEWRVVRKWAYHCHLKFPKLLYENNLAPMENSRILIQIDTVEQWFEFPYDHMLIQQFETRALYNVAPKELLLAHKIFACFERKRLKGRDFFDILFLLKKTQSPNYAYLKQKLGISHPQEVKEYLLAWCIWLDFEALHFDVAPFLFDPHNQSVRMFRKIIEQTEFS